MLPGGKRDIEEERKSRSRRPVNRVRRWQGINPVYQRELAGRRKRRGERGDEELV